MSQKHIRKAAGWGRQRMLWAWVWSKVAHPKFWTATMVVTYTILIFAWVPALLDPPRSLEGLVGIITMYLVASLIVIGALAGIPSAFIGRFTIERWAVVCVTLGIVMYVVVIYTLHWTSDGNRLPQGGTIGALIPGLIGRWVHTTKYAMAPKEEMLHKTNNGDPASD